MTKSSKFIVKLSFIYFLCRIHSLLMLSFCRILLGHIIGNKIRVDANLRLGHEALLEGHQGQMIFPSMFDRFEISSKPFFFFSPIQSRSKSYRV